MLMKVIATKHLKNYTFRTKTTYPRRQWVKVFYRIKPPSQPLKLSHQVYSLIDWFFVKHTTKKASNFYIADPLCDKATNVEVAHLGFAQSCVFIYV